MKPASIYVERGVDPALARQVAHQLMAKDALTAHARDELGISEITTARPVQAALTSAAMFSTGAALPLLMVVVLPAGGAWAYRVRCLFGLSRSSRRDRGESGWCKCSARHSPSHVLGRVCNGSHRRHRQTFRHGALNHSVAGRKFSHTQEPHLGDQSVERNEARQQCGPPNRYLLLAWSCWNCSSHFRYSSASP